MEKLKFLRSRDKISFSDGSGGDKGFLKKISKYIDFLCNDDEISGSRVASRCYYWFLAVSPLYKDFRIF